MDFFDVELFMHRRDFLFFGSIFRPYSSRAWVSVESVLHTENTVKGTADAMGLAGALRDWFR